MKLRKQRFSGLICAATAAAVALCGLTGCTYDAEYGAEVLNALADDLALALIGDDAVFWNCISVSPEQSFGYTASGEPEWYSYAAVSADDLSVNVTVLNAYRRELRKIKRSSLNGRDYVLYGELENILNLYIDYYGSRYAKDFVLIGGGYISDEGGYVAEFASSVENYPFRSEDDVKDLLALTESTGAAFSTYVDYAQDRIDAGYPLYDYTVTAMKDYLDGVYAQGEEYYLYSVAESKINDAEFLTEQQKSAYISDYRDAITNSFMTGVYSLSDELTEYAGVEPELEKSYLASYGNTGKAYYEWSFKQKTGLYGRSLIDAYNDMLGMYLEYAGAISPDKAAYDEFIGYYTGESALLGLTEPHAMLEYLKVAAEDIVPQLSTEREIGIKYMDETAGEISNAVAYYLLSPIDDTGSKEYITLNSCNISDTFELLVTMAHEGYPGHLFAHTYAKEKGTSLLSVLDRCTAFGEGWAMYVELAVLQNIASSTDDVAVKLFCEYKYNEIVANYLTMSLYDMDINYFGDDITELMKNGLDEDTARRYIQIFMGIPTTYISYGYGMYDMLEMHETAKNSLGDRYNETEFNKVLFSEGAAPTLSRANEIVKKYIASA